MIQLELNPKEAQELLRLLDDHLAYGWVALEGEWTLVQDRPPSETLRGVFRRLRKAVRMKAATPDLARAS